MTAIFYSSDRVVTGAWSICRLGKQFSQAILGKLGSQILVEFQSRLGKPSRLNLDQARSYLRRAANIISTKSTIGTAAMAT